VHITQCLPHGKGEPQPFPFSCTEWQQWGAQITLLGNKSEEEGRGKTQAKKGTSPSAHQFLKWCESTMKTKWTEELK